MRRVLCLVTLLVGAIGVMGCSEITLIGEVGGVEFYSVRDSKWDGPNMAALVSKNKESGQVTFHGMGNGPGFFGGAGTALVGSGAVAGGIVGGAAVLHTSKTNVNNSNSNSASAQQSQGQVQGQIQGQAQTQNQTQQGGGHHNHGHHGHGPP